MAEPERTHAVPPRPGVGWRVAYNGLVMPVARALLPAAGALDSKLAAFQAARRDWRGALHQALAARPDVAAGDALWVHAASAGEFLQARALLTALRTAHPERPLVYTYTSPSALPLLERFHGADLVLPLPLDTRENARAWLDAVRPAAAAFVDAELWPNLLDESARRGIRAALVSARLDPRSLRERLPARRLYRALYRGLAVVCAVDESAARGFAAAGVPPERVRVTGDLRIDETLRRAEAVPRSPGLPLPSLLPVVVAGSTWPDDERVLLRALSALRDRGVYFWLVLAPHEVGSVRLARLEETLADRGFTPARWSTFEARESGPADARVDCLLVDTVGLLYRLYVHAALAYVGGGFRDALHNVMEPAAFGVPVVTGPRTRSSWIATDMVQACGLFPVADVEACAAVMDHLLTSREAAAQAGRNARERLAVHAGAVERTLEALRSAAWAPQEETGSDTPSRNRSGGTRSS